MNFMNIIKINKIIPIYIIQLIKFPIIFYTYNAKTIFKRKLWMQSDGQIISNF